MRLTMRHLADLATVLIAVCAVTLTGMRVFAGTTNTVAEPRLTEVEDWARYSADGMGHRVGPANARVTIVEFGDYQCPVCRNFEPHLRAVIRAYPDDVATVYRHWPLPSHPLAYPAARAAECAASQGRFGPFHESLYDSGEWLVNPKPTFLSFAEQAGVDDIATFEECFDSVEPVAAVEQDMSAVRELGGRGTPTLLINNRVIYGMLDSLQLANVVEGFLEESGTTEADS